MSMAPFEDRNGNYIPDSIETGWESGWQNVTTWWGQTAPAWAGGTPVPSTPEAAPAGSADQLGGGGGVGGSKGALVALGALALVLVLSNR